jgi:hypothetical protein
MEVLASTPADPPIKRSTSADTMSSRGPDEPARVAGLARSQSDQSMQSCASPVLAASEIAMEPRAQRFSSPRQASSPRPATSSARPRPRSRLCLRAPTPSSTVPGRRLRNVASPFRSSTAAATPRCTTRPTTGASATRAQAASAASDPATRPRFRRRRPASRSAPFPGRRNERRRRNTRPRSARRSAGTRRRGGR